MNSTATGQDDPNDTSSRALNRLLELEQQFEPCIRCGYCCKKVPCYLGSTRGADKAPCKFLLGDAPGSYLCELIRDDPSLGSWVAIGAGCCSSMNTDRQKVPK